MQPLWRLISWNSHYLGIDYQNSISKFYNNCRVQEIILLCQRYPAAYSASTLLKVRALVASALSPERPARIRQAQHMSPQLAISHFYYFASFLSLLSCFLTFFLFLRSPRLLSSHPRLRTWAQIQYLDRYTSQLNYKPGSIRLASSYNTNIETYYFLSINLSKSRIVNRRCAIVNISQSENSLHRESNVISTYPDT